MRSNGTNETIRPILRAREQISGYRLIKRLGRGGVAEVWEAESPGEYRVALKLVHLSTNLRAGELRALKIIRSIQHPHLLPIYGTWQVENLLVITMELADRSLWDRFREANAQGLRGIPRAELLGYLGPVADAIDYLNDYQHSVAGRHGVGVQHRDLKPHNILLVGDCAKVADFGMARVMEQNVASHTGPCTLPYAAPEYFNGRTSRQSDQYALAVTYCQLRGGRMPFPGTTAQITFGHLCSAPDLEGLPVPERPIVARALAKSPEERWPDCRSFIGALTSLGTAGGESIPDLLARDPNDVSSDTGDEGETGILSPSFLPSEESDFVPIDASEFGSPSDLFETTDPSTGSQTGGTGPGTDPPVVSPECDGPPENGPRLVSTPTGERPNRGDPGHRAGRPARSRAPWSRLGPIVALMVLGLAYVAGDARSPAGRPHHVAPSNGVAVARTGAPDAGTVRAVGPSETGIGKQPTHARSTVPAPEPEAPGRDHPLPSPVPPPSIETSPPAVEKGGSAIIAPSGDSEDNAGRLAPAVPDASGTTARSIDLPASVSVPAGKTARFHVRVRRGDTSKPMSLNFHGLPRGVSVGAPTIPPGTDEADVELSASADAPPGVAEVSARFTSGTDRGEAGIKVDVLPPPPDVVAYERGQAELARGLYDRAEAAFAEVIRLDPDSFDGHLYRGVACYFEGRHREALADYTAAIRLRPGNADAYLVRARAEIELGDTDLALNDYKEAIRLRPDANAHLARGWLLHQLGAYDQALADYNQALQVRPDDPAAHFRRGLTRYYSGDNAGAIEDFTGVIRLDPRHADAYRYRGDAFARLGNSDRAGADHDAYERLNRPSGKNVFGSSRRILK